MPDGLHERDPAARRGSDAEPVRPNMILSNVSATSSTFTHLDFDHCAFIRTKYFNSLFALSNIEGSTFTHCSLDGTVIENSSLRGARMDNCDIEGLVINGVEVDALIARFMSSREADADE
jgi:uncharacterized protein YjbI with pentapeptide repeats